MCGDPWKIKDSLIMFHIYTLVITIGLESDRC